MAISGYNELMCRLFGFRSILQSGVHSSLVDADNALADQSQRHPDGWGVAYYQMGSPHLIKMDSQARDCGIFNKVSGVVSSRTVLAHIRKSTIGSIGPLNTHPFQFGQWVFAHNGNIRNFHEKRSQLLEQVHPSLQPFIFGQTDSELLFFMIISFLKSHDLLEKRSWSSLQAHQVLGEFLEKIIKIIGPLNESQGEYDLTYLTFILTNGDSMLGFQGGQPLRYSTHKTQCPEEKSCPHFNPVCVQAAENGSVVHHLLISSEEIHNENLWSPLDFGEYVGVGTDMTFFKGRMEMKKFT